MNEQLSHVKELLKSTADTLRHHATHYNKAIDAFIMLEQAVSQLTSPKEIKETKPYKRISRSEVSETKLLLNMGVRQLKIAQLFDVNPSVITNIKKGYRYSTTPTAESLSAKTLKRLQG